MNEKQFAEALARALVENESFLADALEDPSESDADMVDGAATFTEAGVLTQNAGLVVRFADGAEFQVSIVQSQRGW